MSWWLSTIRANARYGAYVACHKWFVFVAGLRVRAPLWRLLIHDWSKFSWGEWNAYVQSFYGPWSYKDRPADVVAAFDRAWLHHQHHNPHHWQSWVLREDSGGTKTLRMPEKFVREMVADWSGANRAITGSWGVLAWYAQNYDTIQLHPDTRARVDVLLPRAAGPPPKVEELQMEPGEIRGLFVGQDGRAGELSASEVADVRLAELRVATVLALQDGPKSSRELNFPVNRLRKMEEAGLVVIDPDPFPDEFVPGNPMVVRLPGDRRRWPGWAAWNL